MEKKKIDLLLSRLCVADLTLSDVEKSLCVDKMSVDTYRNFVKMVTSIYHSLLNIELVLRTVSVPCDCVLFRHGSYEE